MGNTIHLIVITNMTLNLDKDVREQDCLVALVHT